MPETAETPTSSDPTDELLTGLAYLAAYVEAVTAGKGEDAIIERDRVIRTVVDLTYALLQDYTEAWNILATVQSELAAEAESVSRTVRDAITRTESGIIVPR